MRLVGFHETGGISRDWWNFTGLVECHVSLIWSAELGETLVTMFAFGIRKRSFHGTTVLSNTNSAQKRTSITPPIVVVSEGPAGDGAATRLKAQRDFDFSRFTLRVSSFYFIVSVGQFDNQCGPLQIRQPSRDGVEELGAEPGGAWFQLRGGLYLLNPHSTSPGGAVYSQPLPLWVDLPLPGDSSAAAGARAQIRACI